MALLNPTRRTELLGRLCDALDDGDVDVLPMLADAWEETASEVVAVRVIGRHLRGLATDDRPEARAWREVVRCGRLVGRNMDSRLVMVPVAGLGMVRAEASFFDRGDGRGPVARLILRGVDDETLTWFASSGWAVPVSATVEADRHSCLDAITRLFQRANGRLDVSAATTV